MTDRERLMAVLNYETYDRLPVVHFGFLPATLAKWVDAGHLTSEEARRHRDGNPEDVMFSKKLGFDFCYHTLFSPNMSLQPRFRNEVVKEFPNGSKHILSGEGVVLLHVPGAITSIPPAVDHLLKDRAAWENLYRPKLQFSMDRVAKGVIRVGNDMVAFDEGADEFLRSGERDYAIGLHCGSLYGNIRNWLTLEGSCYLQVDDEPLFDEIIETNAELEYQCARAALESGAKFDFAHFREDIS